MPTVTATAPFALTLAGPTPSVTAAARAGAGRLQLRIAMFEGAVFGATGGAFFGTPADDPTYGTPMEIP